ncbi:ubiquitin-conjugating enzyme E2 U-like [Branchiostoma floridae]|uniref:Ubiquitin-conjugating enzyme E2 U-like n=1 Tax=Branchiostoma floridae TaxID=7739 RepID=A0A9J7NDM2_BRAFL|nr:ubiquitin-conjugating enzyme E2 U-like [Branchiostoma floridae]
MHSRAYLLLEREFYKLHDDPPWGIDAGPVGDENIFDWSATIMGLKDTIWEGGIFQVQLKFNEFYNEEPPEVAFHTIPFHPNVHSITGRPCIDYLDNIQEWKESYSLVHVLLSIQTLLSNPVVEDAVNDDAARMLVTNPDRYLEMVRSCVDASKRVHAGLSPHEEEERKIRRDFQPFVAPAAKTAGIKTRKVSFDEYHTTWSGIATSKATPAMKNPLLESIRDDPIRQSSHYGLTVEQLQDQMKRQLEEHNALMYGKFVDHGKTDDQREQKLMKINQMRKVYMSKRITEPSTPTPSDTKEFAPPKESEEPWEKEVDDLVAWTHNLDEQHLESV